MKTKTILIAVTLALLPLAPGPARAQSRFGTNAVVERLGLQPAEALRKLSPDGCHVAAIGRSSSGDTLFLDGRPVGSWPRIPLESLVFSPDSSRLAYVAADVAKVRMVLDKQAGSPFDGIGPAGGAVFSPDSKRLAYTARRGDNWFVVEAGRERPVYDGRAPVFSPDSKRLAYVVGRGERKAVAVEDGPTAADCQLGPQFSSIFVEGSIVFSPDSQRIGYVCGKTNRQFYVIDSRPQQEFEAIGNQIVFSPDSRHSMYVAKKDGKWLVVRDGEPGPECDAIGQQSLTFSPDSRRWAYFAKRNQQPFVISSEGEGPAFDATALGSLTFSPDSRRLAYAARLGKQWFVVTEKERSQPFDGFLGLRFSPDSRRLAYGADLGGKFFLVIDGRMGPSYHAFDFPAPPAFAFSPDSAHLVFVTNAGTLGASQAVVIDSQPGPEFDEILPGGPTFRPDGTVEYLAARNAVLYRVKQHR